MLNYSHGIILPPTRAVGSKHMAKAFVVIIKNRIKSMYCQMNVFLFVKITASSIDFRFKII